MTTERILLPDIDVLFKHFTYDKENGKLYWREPTANRVQVGWIVGTPNRDGHLLCGFLGQKYLVHRIIWKMHTGQEPPEEIDHKDTNSQNNKFDNLRPANRHTNLANSSLSFANTSGAKGVNFHKPSGLWRARIMINYKDLVIGYFKTFDEAAKARKEYAEKVHGEYAREGDCK